MDGWMASKKWVVLALAIPGCIVHKAVGDGPEGSSGTNSATSGDESGDPTAGSAGETAGGLCPDSPQFLCTKPYPCSAETCGGLLSWFDVDGCPRPSCGQPEDCAADEVCFRPFDFGGCQSSAPVCEDDANGECSCGGTADCNGSFCLPADEAPPAQGCYGIADSAACLAANCSEFETVPLLAADCTCTAGAPACLLFATGIGGSAAPSAFFHEVSGDVAIFDTDWLTPPIGWRPCSSEDAPAGCGCWVPGEPIPC